MGIYYSVELIVAVPIQESELGSSGIPSAKYAEYIQKNNFEEEYAFDINEDFFGSGDRKLPRLLCIAPEWSFCSGFPDDSFGFGIIVSTLHVREDNNHVKNSLTQEQITKLSNDVKKVAESLGFKNTEPRVYMTLVSG